MWHDAPLSGVIAGPTGSSLQAEPEGLFLFGFKKAVKCIFVIIKLTLYRLLPQVAFYIFSMAQQKRGTKKGTKYIGTNKYHFGKVLAIARRKKGLTQVELAHLLDTSSRVVSYYEREATNPSWDTVCKIAAVLKVSPESMLDPAGQDADTSVTVDRALCRRFEIAHKLPEEARKQLKKFIDTLAKANNISDLQPEGSS